MRKTYTQASLIPGFEDRYDYLKLGGSVGFETFGSERYLNQAFYNSSAWRSLRSAIIVRDEGCDMGIPDQPIAGPIFIHHINPMTPQELVEGISVILDPENLISVSRETHNAIHYGTERHLPRQLVERRPGDTTLW